MNAWKYYSRKYILVKVLMLTYNIYAWKSVNKAELMQSFQMSKKTKAMKRKKGNFFLFTISSKIQNKGSHTNGRYRF